jgi:hypothetical protein
MSGSVRPIAAERAISSHRYSGNSSEFSPARVGSALRPGTDVREPWLARPTAAIHFVRYTAPEDLIKTAPIPAAGKGLYRDLCVKSLLLLGLAAIALNATAMAGGIYIGTPVISGDLSIFANRQESRHAELSAEQLQALFGWLEHHKLGWRGMITPATSEPIQLQVNLRQSDGAITSICLIARSGGRDYLRLTGPGKWAYRSFGGNFKSWAAIRPLSAKELAVLRKIVGAS